MAKENYILVQLVANFFSIALWSSLFDRLTNELQETTSCWVLVLCLRFSECLASFAISESGEEIGGNCALYDDSGDVAW